MKKILLFVIFISASLVATSQESYWMPTGFLPDGLIEALAANPANQEIYAGINSYGIYKSSDLGTNWYEANNGLTNKLVKAIVLGKQGILFAATNGGGIYRSTDNAGTWTAVNNGLTAEDLDMLCLFADKNGWLYAGNWFYGHVYRSKDNGDNWEKIGVDADVHAVLKVGNEIYAGTQHYGVYVSGDEGANWTVSGLSNNDVTCLASNSKGDIFAGTASGLWRKKSGESNWQQIGNGIEVPSIRAVLSNDSDYLFAGSGFQGGAYKSTDNGDKWEKMDDGMSEVSVVSFVQDSFHLVYAGTSDGVFRSRYSTSSIIEGQESGLSVWPNPFSLEVNFELETASLESGLLSVYNLVGEKIFETRMQVAGGRTTSTWDASRFPEGAYYYIITNGTLVKRGSLLLIK